MPKPNKPFSHAFIAALDKALTFRSRRATGEQLREEAMTRLRAGTTISELVENTGWSLRRANRFLHKISRTRPDVMVLQRSGRETIYKLMDH